MIGISSIVLHNAPGQTQCFGQAHWFGTFPHDNKRIEKPSLAGATTILMIFKNKACLYSDN